MIERRTNTHSQKAKPHYMRVSGAEEVVRAIHQVEGRWFDPLSFP